MEIVVKILNALALLVPVLLGTGMLQKYLPFLKGLSNQLIPLFNAVIAFLALFGASPAQASLLGDVAGALSFPAKLMGSVLVSYLTSVIYDKFLKGITPPALVPSKK